MESKKKTILLILLGSGLFSGLLTLFGSLIGLLDRTIPYTILTFAGLFILFSVWGYWKVVNTGEESDVHEGFKTDALTEMVRSYLGPMMKDMS